MGLTKVSTDGVKDDAITAGKIPANAIGVSELASSSVTNVKVAAGNIDNTAIGNNQVSLNKLVQGTSSNDGKFLRANNGANPSFESLPAGITVNNQADNRVITATGTTDTLNAESGVVIDSSGNLGLGTTSPTDYDNSADNLVVQGTGNTGITVATTNTASNTSIVFSDGTGSADAKFRGSVQYIHNGDIMRLLTASTERFRIKDTAFRSVGQATDFTATGISLEQSSVGGRLYVGRATDDTVAEFHRSGTRVGTISVNSSNTSYNTSSDYRLKENVVSISDGITRLKTLKPSRFNFKVDKNTTVDGFIAHEVTPVVPEAITGTKDETQDILYTEEDTIPSGKKVGDIKETVPKYQGIDQSKLVPLLTAALQEAVAKIEVLETKVAALEAKS